MADQIRSHHESPIIIRGGSVTIESKYPFTESYDEEHKRYIYKLQDKKVSDIVLRDRQGLKKGELKTYDDGEFRVHFELY